MHDTIAPAAEFPHHGEAEAAVTGRLLSRDEVAGRLGVSRYTVRRLARRGDLTEILVSPQSPRITEASLNAHLAAHRQAVTAA